MSPTTVCSTWVRPHTSVDWSNRDGISGIDGPSEKKSELKSSAGSVVAATTDRFSPKGRTSAPLPYGPANVPLGSGSAELAVLPLLIVTAAAAGQERKRLWLFDVRHADHLAPEQVIRATSAEHSDRARTRQIAPALSQRRNCSQGAGSGWVGHGAKCTPASR